MLSLALLPALVLGLASSIVASPLITRQSSPPRSCSNEALSSDADSCEVNTPAGAILMTQFWTVEGFSAPDNSFGIHGLWPDFCDGSFPQFCDQSREVSNVTAILNEFNQQALMDYMNIFWVDWNGRSNEFWEFEFNKHGTCISTLDRKCYPGDYQPGTDVVEYLQTTVELFRLLPTFDWLASAGIVPSSSRTYTLEQFQAVSRANIGQEANWRCRNGELTEVFYHFHTQGQNYIPIGPLASSSCPSSGIRYLPKSAIN